MILLLTFLSTLVLLRAERLHHPHSSTRRFPSNVERVGWSRFGQDPNDQYVRIETEVMKLTNEKGLTSTNSYCDTLGSCDPVCYAHLDTDRPNAEWPGGVATEYWPEILRVSNINNPLIIKFISRDSCAKPYHEAVLRVFCEDYDPASKNDLINQWECPITRLPSENESQASWSPVVDCVPKFQPGGPNSIRLNFRYRVFGILRSQCDASPIASTLRPVTSTQEP